MGAWGILTWGLLHWRLSFFSSTKCSWKVVSKNTLWLIFFLYVIHIWIRALVLSQNKFMTLVSLKLVHVFLLISAAFWFCLDKISLIWMWKTNIRNLSFLFVFIVCSSIFGSGLWFFHKTSLWLWFLKNLFMFFL